MAMTDAIQTRPGANPDRASFTTAIEAARDQLITAAGICPGGPPGPAGVIGRAVLSTLLDARRPRYSARTVKCSTSRYHENDDSRPRSSTAITAISVTVSTPPLGTGGPGRSRYPPATPRPPQPPTRRQRRGISVRLTAVTAARKRGSPWPAEDTPGLHGVNVVRPRAARCGRST